MIARVVVGLVATFVVFATTDPGSWSRFFIALAIAVPITVYLIRELRTDPERNP